MCTLTSTLYVTGSKAFTVISIQVTVVCLWTKNNSSSKHQKRIEREVVLLGAVTKLGLAFLILYCTSEGLYIVSALAFKF